MPTDSELYLDEKSPFCRYPTVLPPSKLLAEDGGFLVNGELMIVVEVVALEVIGTSSSGESDNSKPLSEVEENDCAKYDDLLNKTQKVKENMNVNGFQVLLSQV